MHSHFDKNGRLFVACCECERGGNGSDINRCSCGFDIKRWNGAGCYSNAGLIKRFLQEITLNLKDKSPKENAID